MHGAAAAAVRGPLEHAPAASAALHAPHLQAAHLSPARPPQSSAIPETLCSWPPGAPLPLPAHQVPAPHPLPACLPLGSGTSAPASLQLLAAPLPPA